MCGSPWRHKRERKTGLVQTCSNFPTNWTLERSCPVQHYSRWKLQETPRTWPSSNQQGKIKNVSELMQNETIHNNPFGSKQYESASSDERRNIRLREPRWTLKEYERIWILRKSQLLGTSWCLPQENGLTNSRGLQPGKGSRSRSVAGQRGPVSSPMPYLISIGLKL